MIGTLRRELLDRILVVNERHLRRILTVYLHHFNTARPHRTLTQLSPAQADTEPPQVINLVDYEVRRRGSSLYQVGLVIKFVWNRVDPAWRVDEGVNVSFAV
ncbi:MAG: integrase core domain-containing protein [Pseudonocardiaceae bacterium]